MPYIKNTTKLKKIKTIFYWSKYQQVEANHSLVPNQKAGRHSFSLKRCWKLQIIKNSWEAMLN